MLYGIDVGGTKIELAIFDNELNQVEAWRSITPTDDYQRFLSTVTEMVKEADEKTGVRGSVGIGLPGVFDQSGKAISANIPCLNNQSLSEDLNKSLLRPVAFENDSNALVLSEARGGAGDKASILLGVILGTGIAGGLSTDGELYRSKRNLACEFGHTSLSAILQQRYSLPLRQCGCGLTGCIEQYLSGPGLLWLCSYFESDYLSVPELIEAVQLKEPKARQIFAAYVDCLACFFAQLTLMYDPEVIVIGGGVSNIELLYQELPAAMIPYLFSNISPPKICPPKFGDSSGVRGAALNGFSVEVEG